MHRDVSRCSLTGRVSLLRVVVLLSDLQTVGQEDGGGPTANYELGALLLVCSANILDELAFRHLGIETAAKKKNRHIELTFQDGQLEIKSSMFGLVYNSFNIEAR